MRNPSASFKPPGALAVILLCLPPAGWAQAAGRADGAREFVDGDHVLTNCVSVASSSGGRLWEGGGGFALQVPMKQQAFAEQAGDLPTRRLGSMDELKSMLASGDYFPEPCWAGGVKEVPVPQHIAYFPLPGNSSYDVVFGPGESPVRLVGSSYVQLFPRAFADGWPGTSATVAPDALQRACDIEAQDPGGGGRHRRELDDPVAAALVSGGWPSLDAYLEQRNAFQAYRQLREKYGYENWTTSAGFFRNVATHFKQNEIQNPSEEVKNGQKTQKMATDLILHAAAVHPELAQGAWLQALLQLVQVGPDKPAFASLQDAQAKIAGFSGFALPAEQNRMEQDWIDQHGQVPGTYAIGKTTRFQCLRTHPALWQGILEDFKEQARPPQDPTQ